MDGDTVLALVAILGCAHCPSLGDASRSQARASRRNTKAKRPPGSDPVTSEGRWRPSTMNSSTKSKQVDIYTTYELVDPTTAAKWLLQNSVKNRLIDQRVVQKYAADMTAGRWSTIHQGICFNTEGTLVDGQHRLSAIIRSGVPIRIGVTRNAPVEFDAPVDRGRMRSEAVILQKTSRQVAVCRSLAGLERGSLTTPVSIAQLSDTYDANEDAVTAVLATLENSRVRAGIIAGFAFAYPIDPAKILKLCTQVRDGELLTRGDPAFSLRSWMFSHNGRKDTAVVPFAALNAARAFLSGVRLNAIFTGESGYRAICTTRRVRKIPRTPSVHAVETLAMAPGRAADRTNTGAK